MSVTILHAAHQCPVFLSSSYILRWEYKYFIQILTNELVMHSSCIHKMIPKKLNFLFSVRKFTDELVDQPTNHNPYSNEAFDAQMKVSVSVQSDFIKFTKMINA